jgi:SAM-dependent methyltransferase
VPSKQIECWITVARQQLLLLIDNADNIDADDGLLWAIALQCHATEFVFSTTQWEEETTHRISENILTLSHKQIAIIAMYLPIGSLKAPHDFWQKTALLENTPPGLKLLIERDVLDPSTQAKLIPDIARLSHAEDPVSQRVMQQYELNPYPRWLSLDREKTTQSLRERLKNRFPVRYTDSLNLDKPEVMIAGCGTGRHAISTASRYAGSNVLAVDLSLQSLSYAVMQAEKLGQSNIKFAQGDILNLDKLDHRFDLIESSGVLHHMKDPLAGWTTLRNLLKRGGLMRIGLYSSKGRREWNGLREVVPPNLDKERVADFIRERRSRVLMKSLKGIDNVITNIADYYSLSGCRDLLFHENEIQFSIPQIAKIITHLNLRFLGFANLMGSTEKTFKNKFNSSTDYYDLEKWDIFEQEYPNTFISMYQFWCQAKD